MSGTQLKARKIIPGSRWSEGKAVGAKRLRLKGGAGTVHQAKASLRASLAGREGRHWAAGRPVGQEQSQWKGKGLGRRGGLAGSLIGQMRPDEARCKVSSWATEERRRESLKGEAEPVSGGR